MEGNQAGSSRKGWSDTQKVGILFQIIEASGPIKWDALKVPQGRTLKAVQVMIDKEKQKVKRAKEAGEDGEEAVEEDSVKAKTSTGGKKRRADRDVIPGSSEKKPRAPRAPRIKKVKVGSEEGSDGGEGDEKPVVDEADMAY